MPSAKPPRPPSFDDKTFSRRLFERVLTPSGGTYAVFRPTDPTSGEKIGFPRFTEWIRGLRDTVNANALYLDDVKNDLDALNDREATHHAAQAARLSALEEAVQNPPFPG